MEIFYREIIRLGIVLGLYALQSRLEIDNEIKIL